MAKAAHKTTGQNQEIIQCRWYRKKKRRTQVLHRSKCQNRKPNNNPPILPYRLGGTQAILGYSWFAAVQPNIDWKRGWINHIQLPIILQAPNGKKATFVPQTRNVPREITHDQYFIGWVTFHNPAASSTEPPKVPAEYQHHSKVFSEEESQRLPQHTIWDHAIELLPGAPHTLPERLLPLMQAEMAETHKFI